MLTERSGLWRKVIEVWYGATASQLKPWTTVWSWVRVHFGGGTQGRQRLEIVLEKGGFLGLNLKRCLGNGRGVLFWKEDRLGCGCLETLLVGYFKSLHSRTVLWLKWECESTGFGVWHLRWQRNLFVWECELENSLHSSLVNHVVQQQIPDGWSWCSDKTGTFSVKYVYDVISPNTTNQDACFFKSFWNKTIPLKVNAFGRLF